MASKDLYGITDPDGQDYEIPLATAAKKGLVMASDMVTVGSDGKLSVRTATTSVTGVVKATAVVTVASDGSMDVRSASTSAAGIVMLNDDIDSTSTSEAATANAVRKATPTKMEVSGGKLLIKNAAGTTLVEIETSKIAKTADWVKAAGCLRPETGSSQLVTADDSGNLKAHTLTLS